MFNRYDRSQLKIYLGSVNKYQYYYEYYPTNIIINPYWDLALLRLNTPAYPVFMAEHYVINTICLPKEKMLNNVNEEAVISGFGASDKHNVNKTSILLKTVLIINPYFECLELNYTLYDICAVETQHMTCYVSPFQSQESYSYSIFQTKT